MPIEFGRGAFENPDDPVHDDDVDTSVVVLTSPGHLEATREAVERCRARCRRHIDFRDWLLQRHFDDVMGGERSRSGRWP